MSTRPVDGTVAGPGHIVITVTDYLSADDISRVFGEGDGFFREVQEAMAKAWPDDTTQEPGT